MFNSLVLHHDGTACLTVKYMSGEVDRKIRITNCCSGSRASASRVQSKVCDMN